GVELAKLARFEILDERDPDVGKFELAAIEHLNRDEIVLLDGEPKRAFIDRPQKIRDEKADGAPLRQLGEPFDPEREIRPAAFGLRVEDLGHNAHHMAAPLLWRDKPLDAIGKEQEAGAIAILDGAEREKGGYLGDAFRFGRFDRSELLARRKIDRDHHRHLSFLRENLHEGIVHARTRIPVDEAHIVAGLIGTRLGVCHPEPAKRGLVSAGELVFSETRRDDLDAPKFFYELAGDHDRSGDLERVED